MEILNLKVEIKNNKQYVVVVYKNNKGYLKEVRFSEYDLSKKSYDTYMYFKDKKEKGDN